MKRYSLKDLIDKCANRQASYVEQQLLNTVLNRAFVNVDSLRGPQLISETSSLRGDKNKKYQITSLSKGKTYEIEIDYNLYVLPKPGINKRHFLEQEAHANNPVLTMDEVFFAAVDPKAGDSQEVQDEQHESQTLTVTHGISPQINPQTGLFDVVAIYHCHADNKLEIHKGLDADAINAKKAQVHGVLSPTGEYTQPTKPKSVLLIANSNKVMQFNEGTAYDPIILPNNVDTRKIIAIEEQLKKIESKYFHSNKKAQQDTKTFAEVKQLLPNETFSMQQKLVRYNDIFKRSATQTGLAKILAGRDDVMQQLAIAVRAVCNAPGDEADTTIDALKVKVAEIVDAQELEKTAIKDREATQAQKLLSLTGTQLRRLEFLADPNVKAALCSLYDTIDIKLPTMSSEPTAKHSAIVKMSAIIKRETTEPSPERKLELLRDIIKLAKDAYSETQRKFYLFTPVHVDKNHRKFLQNIAEAGELFTEAVLKNTDKVQLATNIESKAEALADINAPRAVARL
jgi:hypothetical protein